MSFDYLGLSKEIQSAVEAAGYTTPTPIQKQVIPSILMGRDILGIAQTGTGKTAGFTLPMIDILAEGRAKARIPRSLIIEPTRELAVQIKESFEKYGKNHKLTSALLIGGTSMEDQVAALNKSVDVLIATPGRLLDHFGRGNVMLNGIEILVIDEADRMLDMGFIPDVERIRKLILGKPQTLFFSATMPPPIKKLTDAFLDDPKFIEVASPTRTAETIAQNFVKVARRDKAKVLKKLLSNKDVTSAIIFCNRKKDVTAVYKDLKAAHFNARELHGDMDQSSRLEVLGLFKDGTVDYLIASDVAARGLDIKDVSHIINYDVPLAVEDYIHRIGRTGRAGKKGNAIMLLDNKDREMFEKIERFARVKILPLGEAKPEAKPSDAKPAAKTHEAKKPEPKSDHRGRHQKPAAKQHQMRDAKPHEKHETKPQEKRDSKPHDNRDTKKRDEKKPRRHAHGVQEMEDHVGPGMGGHVPAFMVQPPNKK